MILTDKHCDAAIRCYRIYLVVHFGYFFCFTLYSAHSRAGKGNLGNLMLRHSVLIMTLPFSTFYWIFEISRVEWRYLTPRLASLPERINIFNIFLTRLEIEPITISFKVARLFSTLLRYVDFYFVIYCFIKVP